MVRKQLDFALILLVVAGSAIGIVRAQTLEHLLGTPILSEEERRSMMFSFVSANLPELQVPQTLPEWEAKRTRLRGEILDLLGLENLERRGPLRWESRGVLERPSYTIEKIIYESYPGLWVPALVYVPKGNAGPRPAMVSIPGHVYCEGKASLSAQARSVNLVERGIIVLAYDYLMTSERNTGADACAGMPYGGGNDHGLSAFSYTRGTPTALEILDGIRAVDYLLSRRDVDPNRIGFTGESGGGNSTYWVAALDERVRLAVPVAAVTSFDYWILNDRNWDWHQRPPGIRRVADIWTLLALIAPRPLLVIASLRGTDSEECPSEEAELATRRAQVIYRLYGKPENISFFESNTNHGYQQDKRERMYAYVETHFLGRSSKASAEVPFQFEPQPVLRCGLPADKRTFQDIFAEWLSESATRPAVPKNLSELRILRDRLGAELKQLLGISTIRRDALVEVQAVRSVSAVAVRRLIIQSEAGIRLPVVEVTPRNREPSGVVLILDKSPERTDLVVEMVAQGLRVAVADLRGRGEIESGGGRTSNWAWFVGRTWPGMWAHDISAIVDELTKEESGFPVAVLADEETAKAALFATLLDPRIMAVFAPLTRASYRQDVQAGSSADLPGILAVADLDVIVGLLAPRSCWIAPPSLAGDAVLQSAFAWSRSVYERVGESPEALRLGNGEYTDPAQVARWTSSQLGKQPSNAGR